MKPRGVARLVYSIVGTYCAFYLKDRPLSSEVEKFEEALGSDETMKQPIEQAPLALLNEFFSTQTARGAILVGTRGTNGRERTLI